MINRHITCFAVRRFALKYVTYAGKSTAIRTAVDFLVVNQKLLESLPIQQAIPQKCIRTYNCNWKCFS